MRGRVHVSFLSLLLIIAACHPARKESRVEITWDNHLSLPSEAGRAHRGVAGAFAGLVGEELLVAGGANFPDAYPWEGGAKRWWNRVYVKDLRKPADEGGWRLLPDTLPEPVAYGLSVPVEGGVLCIGGCRKERCSRAVYVLRLEDGRLQVDSGWPLLPVPLANMAGARIGEKIYIAGGQERMDREEATRHFFVLDLSSPAEGWKSLPTWPGPPRGYAVGVAQDACFYLFSGRDYRADGSLQVLIDGYRYDPRTAEWEALDGDFPVMAANAIPVGEEGILFLGGVPRILPGSVAHPGFDNTVRLYRTAARRLSSCGVSPYSLAVTAPVVCRGNTFYIVSGEVKPGIRTDCILRGEIAQE